MRIHRVLLLILSLLCLHFRAAALAPAPASPRVLDPRSYGAAADGATLDTTALQKAIDAASAAGGGTVRLARGTFLSGSLDLKSNVTLQIDQGATLLGSIRHADYHKNRWYALLEAKGQENIAVTGGGVIDGRGATLVEDVIRRVKAGEIKDAMSGGRPGESNRPQLIEFIDCRGVRVAGVTLKDSASWVQKYENCEGLTLDGVTVRSTAFWNNDGMDICDCRKVLVKDCVIDAADDGICLKSHTPGLACEDVRIEHCRIRSSASALKFGTASRGGFRRVTAHGLYVYDTYRSAIALESVDGGALEDVEVSSVTAKNTGNAIFIKLGHRNKSGAIGSLRNVSIRDVNVEVPSSRPDTGYNMPGPEVREPHNLIPSSVSGLPGHPVENVTLKNITITYGGGGKREVAERSIGALAKVPEREDRYPEFSMFGELPAWGFYARHAVGLKLKNVAIKLKTPDYRAGVVCDDVKGMSVNGLRVLSAGEEPVIVLSNVHEARLRDVPPPAGAKEFIRKMGACTGIEE